MAAEFMIDGIVYMDTNDTKETMINGIIMQEDNTAESSSGSGHTYLLLLGVGGS